MKKHIEKGQKKTIKVEANEISEIDVKYISLVERGANRVPFRILKSENGMINLETIYKQDGDAPKTPTLVAVSVAKGDNQEGLIAAVEAMEGVEVTAKHEQEAGTILMLNGATEISEDVVIMKGDNDIAVMVENCKKYFESWPESSDFLENIKKASFFPTMRVATDVMMDTVANAMYETEKGESPSETIATVLKDYSMYVQDLANAVPTTAFKFEGLEPVEVEKSEDNSEGETEDTAKAEGEVETTEKSEETTEDTAKSDDEMQDTEKSEEETTTEKTEEVDSKVDVEKEEGEGNPADTDQLREMLNGLLSPLTDQMTEMGNSMKDLTTKLEEVEQNAASMKDQLEQVETVAKSATEAVEGTVVGGHEGDAHGIRTEQVEKSDEGGMWDTALKFEGLE